MSVVEIRYPSLYIREYRCSNIPFSKLIKEKHVRLLKGKFKKLGRVGFPLAKKFSAIPGIEATISKDWIKVKILRGHKWKEVEPLIVDILSEVIVKERKTLTN